MHGFSAMLCGCLAEAGYVVHFVLVRSGPRLLYGTTPIQEQVCMSVLLLVPGMYVCFTFDGAKAKNEDVRWTAE